MRKTPVTLALLVALSGCVAPSTPTPAATPTAVSSTRAPSSAPASPTPVSSASFSFDPSDLATPRPGGYCATKSLGKTFVKDGVTYRCSAPKPYRWRRV